jgi:hypothetical protein
VCNLDNILICLTNQEEPQAEVQIVLELQQQFGLYATGKKCYFGVLEVTFLGFVIISGCIAIESDYPSPIKDLPTLESVRDIQVLVGFTSIYRRFVRKNGNVTRLITHLLKMAEISRTP